MAAVLETRPSASYIDCTTVAQAIRTQTQQLQSRLPQESSVEATVIQIGSEPKSFCLGLRREATASSVSIKHYVISCSQEGTRIIDNLAESAVRVASPQGLILGLPSRPKPGEDGALYDISQRLLELTNKLPKEILDPDGTQVGSDVIPGVVAGAVDVGNAEGLNPQTPVAVIGACGRFGSRLVARLLESGVPWENITRVDTKYPELNINPQQAIQSAELSFLCTSLPGFISPDKLPIGSDKRLIDIGWNVCQAKGLPSWFNGKITPERNGLGSITGAAVIRTLTAMTYEQLTGSSSGIQYRFNRQSLAYLTSPY